MKAIVIIMNANILDFGANAELLDNASAINAAIVQCSETGGGRVTVPQGRFVTGTVYLRDNVELHLEIGAVLKASTDSDAYNQLDVYPQNGFSTNEGWDYRHLVIAYNVKNVSITGLGCIEGCAEHWFGEPSFGHGFGWRYGFRNTKDRDKGRLRPGQLIVFIESQDIRVNDITICASTCWSCFFHGCENIQVRGVKIFNARDHANTDGLDIDSCKFVTISDCIIDTGDDCIAIRGNASKLADQSRICEYITVTNCVLSCAADAFRIGVGTGAVHHVRVSNIVVRTAGNVIDFNTSYLKRGHCELDDINFSNISAVDTGRAFKILTSDVSISRVTLENLRVECMAASLVKAETAGSLSDVTLRGIDLFIKPCCHELTEALRLERGEYALECSEVDKLRIESYRCFFDPEVASLWSGTAIGCGE